jgi:hypothetical protein
MDVLVPFLLDLEISTEVCRIVKWTDISAVRSAFYEKLSSGCGLSPLDESGDRPRPRIEDSLLDEFPTFERSVSEHIGPEPQLREYLSTSVQKLRANHHSKRDRS